MATQADDDRLIETGGSPDRGYAAWKRAKIEAGLAESRDRAQMIPIEQIWRNLDLER